MLGYCIRAIEGGVAQHLFIVHGIRRLDYVVIVSRVQTEVVYPIRTGLDQM